ncbi:MAG: SsrA-binding protein SmpB [Candidatus Pacebacteria bacterium]|nr:SsrA-binding protein SmpB [Candidatus Paceibacterota bacterium]
MKLLINKKANYDYSIQKTFQAGIVLAGPEVKSLRNKSGSLTGSYVKVIGGEVFLVGAQITPYKFADNSEYDPKQTRKLLLKKKQIVEMIGYTEKKGWSLVPLSFELVKNKIKLNVGLGKGKKEFEKRATLKKKAIQKDIDRHIKDRLYIK